MALNYLKCLLRFGPGFTCWAIWESWAACSVVPCTADVCEGVTELLLLLLCTSSIINYKKSNELNSVNDKSEQQVGAQLPLTLYRISVYNAFSLIWTFLISSLSFDVTFYYGISTAFFVTSPTIPRALLCLLMGTRRERHSRSLSTDSPRGFGQVEHSAWHAASRGLGAQSSTNPRFGMGDASRFALTTPALQLSVSTSSDLPGAEVGCQMYLLISRVLHKNKQSEVMRSRKKTKIKRLY